jgi:hypothetical protein
MLIISLKHKIFERLLRDLNFYAEFSVTLLKMMKKFCLPKLPQIISKQWKIFISHRDKNHKREKTVNRANNFTAISSSLFFISLAYNASGKKLNETKNQHFKLLINKFSEKRKFFASLYFCVSCKRWTEGICLS